MFSLGELTLLGRGLGADSIDGGVDAFELFGEISQRRLYLFAVRGEWVTGGRGCLVILGSSSPVVLDLLLDELVLLVHHDHLLRDDIPPHWGSTREIG